MSDATWTIDPSGMSGHRITATGDRIDADRRENETLEAFEQRLAYGRIDELIIDWICTLEGNGDPDAAEAPALTVRQYRSDSNVLILPRLGGHWLVDCDLAAYRTWATKVTKSHGVDRFADAAARTLNACLTWAHVNDRWPSDHAAFGGFDARKAVVLKRRRSQRTPSKPKQRASLISLEDCPMFDVTQEFGWHLAEAAVELWGEQARPLGKLPEVQTLTGTRIAEAFVLHTGEFNLSAAQAHVTWQTNRDASWKKQPDLADFDPPRILAKTGLPDGHPVALWEWGMPILDEVLDHADEHHGGWLFAACIPNSKRPLDRFETLYREVRRRHDVSYPFTSHWHRHAYASYNLAPENRGGFDRSIDEVAEWLGDDPGTVRDTYEHSSRRRRPGWSSRRPGTSTRS